MKKILSFALVIAGAFLFAPAASAQFTTVTATVTDPSGIPYAAGTMSAVLVPSAPGGFRLSGQPYSGRIGPLTLDSAGKFTANFGDVTLITPSAQWQITINSNQGGIAPPLGTGPQTFIFTSSGTTISGGSVVNISASLNALAPKLTNFAAGGGSIAGCSTTGGVAYENGTANNLTCQAQFTWDSTNFFLTSGPGTSGQSTVLQNFASGAVAGYTNTTTYNAALVAPGSFSNLLMTMYFATDPAQGFGEGIANALDAPTATAASYQADLTNFYIGIPNAATNSALQAGNQVNAYAESTGTGTLGGAPSSSALANGALAAFVGRAQVLNASTYAGTLGLAVDFAALKDAGAITGGGSQLYDIGYFAETPNPGTTLTAEYYAANALTGATDFAFYNLNGKSRFDKVTLNTLNYVTGGGTANAQTVTLLPSPGVLVVGLEVRWLPIAANSTTTPTLNVNGLGAATITKFGTAAVAANDITTTAIADAIYDGTRWQLQNPQTNSGTGSVTNIATTAPITGGPITTTGTIACTTCTTNAAALTNNVLVKGAGGQATQTSSVTDNGTTVSTTEAISGGSYSTATNCNSTANPAVCGSAAAGTVNVPAAISTVVVNTTAVTANSEIFVQYDSSLGTRLGVTCNTTVALPSVTSRTAGTSFTIAVPAAPVTNPACYSYHIIN